MHFLVSLATHIQTKEVPANLIQQSLLLRIKTPSISKCTVLSLFHEECQNA